MELEITPKPSEGERAAIEAALAQEAEKPASAWPEAVLPGRDDPVEPELRRPPRRFPHMFEDCIRCREAPAVDELGYCGHCHWAVRAEIEEGFYQLREYLSSWARFTDWCDAHGLALA